VAEVDRLLDEARAAIAPRVTVEELDDVRASGGLVVDIRPVELRQRDGELPGAVVIDRNVLEWRLDPTSDHRIPGDVRDVDDHLEPTRRARRGPRSGCGTLRPGSP
jgi:hypothetical protein